MFLETKFKLPEGFKIHSFKQAKDVPADDPWRHYNKKPDHLCILNDAPFPTDVKNKITEIYKAVGVENPLMQKLVEPNALAFGGREKEGEWDLKNVDWEEMVSYFEIEAQSISRNREAVKKLQDVAYKKHGQLQSHYMVYSNGDL